MEKRKKLPLLIENISEPTAACLFTMVQGNLLAIGVSHLLIASQTGIVAGALAYLLMVIGKTSSRWLIALVLGIVTAFVDYLIHPGSFGSIATEAMVTGIGAAILSLIVGSTLNKVPSLKRRVTRAVS